MEEMYRNPKLEPNKTNELSMMDKIDALHIKNGVSPPESKVKSVLDITVHKQPEVFSRLHDAWEALAEKSDQTVCMSPDWTRCWWEYFGRNQDRTLYLITVHDRDKLVAIFPFYQGISRIAGFTVERRLQLLGSGGSKNERFGFSNDYGISDFLDLLVDPDYNEPVAELFVSLLASEELSSHHITFHQVRDDSFIKQCIYPRLDRMENDVSLEHTDTCPYIDVRGIDSLKAFIKRSKSNARRRFRQTLRAIGPENEYVIEEAKTWEDAETMMETLIRLHQQRWNEIGFPGAFHDERFRKFFREILYVAYQNNRLWFKQARDDRGVCASRMLLLYHGRYYDYMSGFDDHRPSAKYRPGIGLLLNLVEDALAESVEFIELLRGEESYKYDFARQNLKNWKITIPASKHINIPAKLLHAFSFIYKYNNREIQLLKVQYDKGGWWSMIGGYVRFRVNSLKYKLKS